MKISEFKKGIYNYNVKLIGRIIYIDNENHMIDNYIFGSHGKLLNLQINNYTREMNCKECDLSINNKLQTLGIITVYEDIIYLKYNKKLNLKDFTEINNDEAFISGLNQIERSLNRPVEEKDFLFISDKLCLLDIVDDDIHNPIMYVDTQEDETSITREDFEALL